jgi:hypothetical protein
MQISHTNVSSRINHSHHHHHRRHHHPATKNQSHICINIKSLDKAVTMVDFEDYKSTLDITKKQRFETLERRWFHI